MDPLERLSRIVSGSSADRAPCICPGGMMNMIVKAYFDENSSWPEAHTDGAMMAQLAQKSYREGAFENYGVPFCMTVEAEAMGAKVVLGDRNTEPRVTAYCLPQSAEWQTLNKIDFSQGRPREVLEAIRLLKNLKDGVPVIGNLVGPISLATSLVDPMVFYKEMRKCPEDVHGLLRHITEVIIAFGLAQLKAGADFIAISDPSGTGEILGEALFEAFALPYLNQIAESLGSYKTNSVIIHICGRLKSIYPSLKRLQCPVLSFDALTNAAQVREHVPGKILMGNISTYTLEFGTEEQITQMAKGALEQGVGILAPACGLGMDTPIRNLQAMKRGIPCD